MVRVIVVVDQEDLFEVLKADQEDQDEVAEEEEEVVEASPEVDETKVLVNRKTTRLPLAVAVDMIELLFYKDDLICTLQTGTV